MLTIFPNHRRDVLSLNDMLGPICWTPACPQILRQSFYYNNNTAQFKEDYACMPIWVCTVSQGCGEIQILIAKACKLQKRPGNHTGQLVTLNLANPLLILRVLSTQYSLSLTCLWTLKWNLCTKSMSGLILGLDLGFKMGTSLLVTVQKNPI